MSETTEDQPNTTPNEARDDILFSCFKILQAVNIAADNELMSQLDKIAKPGRNGIDNERVYTFKSRVKEAKQIASKVRRKRRQGEELLKALRQGDLRRYGPSELAEREAEAKKLLGYSPHHVTDVVGCRYVTLYQSDIPAVVEKLLKAIGDFNAKRENGEPLVTGREFVIYTNRPENDPLSIVAPTMAIVGRSQLAELIGLGHIRTPENRKSAYSSVHFVFERKVADEYSTSGQEISVFFEIQIRDIFEEGWGEVQHDLLYSEKDNEPGDDGADQAAKERWQMHLNALKTFVDGCGQQASNIKRDLEMLRRRAAPTAMTLSITELELDREKVSTAMKAKRAPAEAVRETVLAYGRLIDDDGQAAPEKRAASFMEAASKFDRVLAILPKRVLTLPVDLPGHRPVRYHLMMEAASSRVLAAPMVSDPELERRLLQEAREIYEAVLEDEPSDPIAAMRIGKVLSRQGASHDDLKRAVDYYRQAIENLETDKATGPSHWVAISARIDYGLALWRQSRMADDSDDASIALLRQVVEKTVEGFRVWQEQSTALREVNKVSGHKAGANAIYFLAELAVKAGGLGDDQRAMLEKLIKQVEGTNIEQYSDYYKTIDNIMRGHAALGNKERARTLAFENVKTLRDIAEKKARRPLNTDKIENYLDGSAEVCFQAAKEVLGADL